MARPVFSDFSKYLQFMALAIAFFGLSACSGVEIVGADENRVWVRNPVLSVASSDKLAQEHCARYGKTAVLESDLSVGDGANEILIYTCN